MQHVLQSKCLSQLTRELKAWQLEQTQYKKNVVFYTAILYFLTIYFNIHVKKEFKMNTE